MLAQKLIDFDELERLYKTILPQAALDIDPKEFHAYFDEVPAKVGGKCVKIRAANAETRLHIYLTWDGYSDANQDTQNCTVCGTMHLSANLQRGFRR